VEVQSDLTTTTSTECENRVEGAFETAIKFSKGAIKGELSAYIDFLFYFGLLLTLKRMWFVEIQ
jgi:hypothetical protein